MTFGNHISRTVIGKIRVIEAEGVGQMWGEVRICRKKNFVPGWRHFLSWFPAAPARPGWRRCGSGGGAYRASLARSPGFRRCGKALVCDPKALSSADLCAAAEKTCWKHELRRFEGGWRACESIPHRLASTRRSAINRASPPGMLSFSKQAWPQGEQHMEGKQAAEAKKAVDICLSGFARASWQRKK